MHRPASSVTEAGGGDASFNGQAYQVQANYVRPITEKTNVIPYLGLRYMQRLIHRSQKMIEQNIFGRYRRVRLEFKTKMAVRMKTLPVDVLKIDKAFVDGLPDDSSLVQAIIHMARSLNLHEGIAVNLGWDYDAAIEGNTACRGG